MPLAAFVARLAPPARAVIVPAAENVPTVRTVVSASALKSAGKVEEVVAVAGMPIASKLCVYRVEVDTEMAAKTIDAKVDASTEAKLTTIKNREVDLDLNIDVPFFDKVTSQMSSG